MQTQKNLIWKSTLKEFLIFFGPLICFYLIYYLFSAGFLMKTAFQKISMILVNGKWVGFKNFELLLTDASFITSLENNFLFALVSIIAGLTIGFFIAVTLSSGVRGKSVYYAIFLLPTLMPLALVATVFRNMLESRYGSVNETLRTIGLESLAQSWLIEPNLAFGVVIILFVYLIGLPILYYTANLSNINTSLIEAAVLDGASTTRLFFQILFPLMKGTHKTIIISTLLMSFRAFDIVFFSTGGGPAGTTEITGTYVYNFSTSGTNLGYASAAAFLVMIVSLLISAIQLFLGRKS
ncbi:sugar ABC transporter permease [Parasalinivibrio latis]|uniref:carbohydrate ABC transporter permease n=1 Tax=Parasalinivibrio latis TaxID=2952610 RepID=UPI0030E22FB0